MLNVCLKSLKLILNNTISFNGFNMYPMDYYTFVLR